jgi:hypothetical protein
MKISAAVVGGTLASGLVLPGAYAAGSDEIRVGLIGWQAAHRRGGTC